MAGGNEHNRWWATLQEVRDTKGGDMEDASERPGMTTPDCKQHTISHPQQPPLLTGPQCGEQSMRSPFHASE